MERRTSVGTGQPVIGVYYLIYHLLSTPPKALYDFIPNTLLYIRVALCVSFECRFSSVG